MAYRRSRARTQFDAEIREILRIVGEAHSKKCSSAAVREYALCNAILLTSAKLESYLEDLVADWAASIRSKGITTERLPRRTRAFLLNQPTIISAYRRFFAEEDEAALLTKIETTIAQAQYEFALDGRGLPVFHAKVLYADRKYPSPKNLRRLFDRLGIENIFIELNKLAKRDAEGMLTSFNDLRTELAHVGMPVGVPATDIKNRIRDTAAMVGYIDRVFFRSVRASVGSDCWT
jgi:hypothetical protein